MGLEEDTFIESLPLFRRVFSNMDSLERRRLLEAVQGQETVQAGYKLVPDIEELWAEQVVRITQILQGVDARAPGEDA